MKSRQIKLVTLLLAVLGVVAWSPPSSEDLVVGTGNTLSSPTNFAAIVGNDNKVVARSSLVVGELNDVTPSGSPYVTHSLICGYDNTVNTGTTRVLVGGEDNTVNAAYSLVTGMANTVRGSTVNSIGSYSAAIGANNLVATSSGWAAGMGNEVYGQYALALGSSNKVYAPSGYAFGDNLKVGSFNSSSSNPYAIALGRWNADMKPEDVLVVGTGTSVTSRSTGLRITSDGGVILGRAQGDISMGEYGD